MVETVESFVEDAARLKRPSGALSASVARLAPAGRAAAVIQSVSVHRTAVF